MATQTLNRTHNNQLHVAITESDFDLTAANTTAQNVYATLPANAQVTSVAVKTSAATTATSLTAFTLKVGTSAGGEQYFSGTDIDQAGQYFDGSVTGAFQTAEDLIYLNFAPTGANWSAADMSIANIDVYINYIIATGEVL